MLYKPHGFFGLCCHTLTNFCKLILCHTAVIRSLFVRGSEWVGGGGGGGVIEDTNHLTNITDKIFFASKFELTQ